MSQQSKTVAIALVIAMQLTFLLSMTAKKSIALKTGSPITVMTAPIDPRDLFRGDYVILNYTFSRYRSIPNNPLGLEESQQTGNGHNWQRIYQFYADNNGRTVYVLLDRQEAEQSMEQFKIDEPIWTAQGVSFDKPTAGSAFLKGRLRQWGQIDFGIDAYYVQEGTGKEIEKSLARRQNNSEEVEVGLVNLVIDKTGKAMIKDLRIRKVANSNQ